MPTAAIKVVRLPDYGMRCAGSAHAFVRFDRLPSPLAQAYPDEWLDELAALHWIIGLTDWNLGSVGLATSGRRAGRPLSFDHASSWPRPPRPSVPPLPLMSHPVLAKGTTGFGRTVIDKVRALRPEVLYATVRARGIDDTAAVLGVTRLLSLQKHGRIVPTDYPGGIRGWTV